MSDERTMFEYEPRPEPPPRWFYVANIVAGAVFFWMDIRRQHMDGRLGLHMGILQRTTEVLLPVAFVTLGISGLVKVPIARKVIAAISLAAMAVGWVTLVASFFAD